MSAALQQQIGTASFALGLDLPAGFLEGPGDQLEGVAAAVGTACQSVVVHGSPRCPVAHSTVMARNHVRAMISCTAMTVNPYFGSANVLTLEKPTDPASWMTGFVRDIERNGISFPRQRALVGIVR